MRYFLLSVMLFAQIASGQSIMLLHNRQESGKNLLFDPRPSLVASSEHAIFPTNDLTGQPEKKNVTTAVLYSLLLPGMGELYVGNYNSGKYFTIVEGALWLTLGAYDWYATSLQDDARRYAMQHAQANINGKDDQFFVDIGEFRTVYDYNEQILRNRAPDKLYNAVSSYWNWDSDANRNYFSNLRIASDERFNDMRFVAAAIAVNHLVSAINAARLTISHNKSVGEASLFDVHASVMGGLTHPNGIIISISKNF